jgi:mRNA interferase RelE/StbE
MSYELEFHHEALKEWHRLDGSVRAVLKKKLAERLESPHIVNDLFHTAYGVRYKIKHKAFRLIYAIDDGSKRLRVLGIGKRERGEAYADSAERR